MSTTYELTHRKATAGVHVLKPDGMPAAFQNVEIRQTSHSFLFGCGAFDTVKLMRTRDEKERSFLLERDCYTHEEHPHGNESPHFFV